MFGTYEDWKKKKQQYGCGGTTPAPYFPQSPFVQAVAGGGVPLLEPSLDDWRMTEEKLGLYRQALDEFVPEDRPSGLPGGFAGSYATDAGNWNAFHPDGNQFGMANPYGMPGVEYPAGRGGMPDWMPLADEADMLRTSHRIHLFKRLLARSPLSRWGRSGAARPHRSMRRIKLTCTGSIPPKPGKTLAKQAGG